MIRTEFLRRDYRVKCDGCGSYVEPEAPSFRLMFGCLEYEDGCESMICLCEDCGNDLQNDICDDMQMLDK